MHVPDNESIFDLLVRTLAVGSGNAILQQEAAGQQSFIKSDTLPSDMSTDVKRTLEAAGVVFLGRVERDELFQYVQLPAGWKKVATTHSMHSDLVDDKGRKRGGIFYKAASYDRNAHMSVNRRYNTGIDYGLIDTGVVVGLVLDGDDVIFRTPEIAFSEDKVKYAAQDTVRAQAKAWLNQHFPRWEDASAYWDDGVGLVIIEPSAQNVTRGQWYRVKRHPESESAKLHAGCLVGAVEVDSTHQTVSVYTMEVFENRGGVAIRMPLSDLTNR